MPGFCVQDSDMSEALKLDMAGFYTFCIKRTWQQQHQSILPETADKYVHHLKQDPLLQTFHQSKACRNLQSVESLS